MGKDKQPAATSRRQFFSFLIRDKKETIKMLTADGKLVEVDKAVYDQVAGKQKATNKEIYDWMENPSKKDK